MAYLGSIEMTLIAKFHSYKLFAFTDQGTTKYKKKNTTTKSTCIIKQEI